MLPLFRSCCPSVVSYHSHHFLQLWTFDCGPHTSNASASAMGFIVASSEAVAVVNFNAFATRESDRDFNLQISKSSVAEADNLAQKTKRFDRFHIDQFHMDPSETDVLNHMDSCSQCNTEQEWSENKRSLARSTSSLANTVVKIEGNLVPSLDSQGKRNMSNPIITPTSITCVLTALAIIPPSALPTLHPIRTTAVTNQHQPSAAHDWCLFDTHQVQCTFR